MILERSDLSIPARNWQIFNSSICDLSDSAPDAASLPSLDTLSIL
jgi:hypothetical protein